MAVTKWVPYSSAGAAVAFVAGFVLGLPPAQAIVSAAMAATLIFSGLLFRSFGREKERAEAQQ